MAGMNVFKSRWLGRVAARSGGFEGGQMAGLNALKKRCLVRVAARVALERPAGGFGACSCRGKACGRVWMVWTEVLESLSAGKRQA